LASFHRCASFTTSFALFDECRKKAKFALYEQNLDTDILGGNAAELTQFYA
jgi:hypothetical protein